MTIRRRSNITFGTVTINGNSYGAAQMIWSGLRMHEALCSTDGFLAVPFCHVDDDVRLKGCAIYRLRPKNERYRFIRARNGIWILEEREDA